MPLANHVGHRRFLLSPLQRTLLSNGSLSRMPPPEQGASQGKLAGRRLSLGPQSTAKSAASDSTGRKRPAAGSTAKKGGGPGSRSESVDLTGVRGMETD